MWSFSDKKVLKFCVEEYSEKCHFNCGLVRATNFFVKSKQKRQLILIALLSTIRTENSKSLIIWISHNERWKQQVVSSEVDVYTTF